MQYLSLFICHFVPWIHSTFRCCIYGENPSLQVCPFVMSQSEQKPTQVASTLFRPPPQCVGLNQSISSSWWLKSETINWRLETEG